MLSRRIRHIPALLLLGSGLAQAAFPAPSEVLAVVGILQGNAVLVRQAARFTLAEGAALDAGDIVETPAGAHAPLEFGDGTIVGVADATRLILKPRLTRLKNVGEPRLYLLEGWVKVRSPPQAETAFAVLGPRFKVDPQAGALVAHASAEGYAIFAESGSAQLAPREGAHADVALKAGDFATRSAAVDKPVASARLDPVFLQAMPRLFRDPLPARASLLSKREVTLQALGPVSYADVSAWLHSEPGVRRALSRQWQSRAADRAFRAEVAANLRAHMEWERVIFPERFLPKKPPPPRPPPAPAAAPADTGVQ